MRLIDADEMRDFLNRQYKYCHGYMGNKKEIYREALRAVKSYVHSEGQIDAEPIRHGHWVVKETAAGALYTVCSHCNASVKYNDEYGTVVMNLKGANYCPNCGAKMDEN